MYIPRYYTTPVDHLVSDQVSDIDVIPLIRDFRDENENLDGLVNALLG